MSEPLEFRLGVKTDPIEYRYSHGWLFQLLSEEGVRHVQIGTHFELYQLPDEFFHELREQAEQAGVVIDSMFTAHRELGGFFREEAGYEQVARRNFERYIQIGGILGVKSVGSNPGAVMRDRIDFKPQGWDCYIKHLKELSHWANDCGVQWLTIEPMSCLAEPPTLPAEIVRMGDELKQYARENAGKTAQFGYCTDIAHGYADHDGKVIYDHFELLDATIPYLYEVHLKNTDANYDSTFGFQADERRKGIIDVSAVRRFLVDRQNHLPVRQLTGYLEIGGPKLGRDYSDHQLEESLRESLRHLRESYLSEPDDDQPDRSSVTAMSASGDIRPDPSEGPGSSKVLVSPSMMCVDALNFETNLRAVERLGVDMLHMDVMDGHFVPNMPMGLGILEQLSGRTDLPIDVHLMVENNDLFIELLEPLNIYQISVHVESCTHLDRTLSRIRESGCRAGAAINPATPLEAIEYALERLDHVLVMTVNPGYAGQKLVPNAIRKIADCRDMLDRHGFEQIPIQVDGNVSFQNIPPMVAAGAANLVAGTSSIFHASATMAENKQRLDLAIRDGIAERNAAVN